MFKWLKFADNNDVDHDILKEYEQIELLILTIDEQFQSYFQYVDHDSNYYQTDKRNDGYHSIATARELFTIIKNAYGDCWTKRAKLAHKDFSLSSEKGHEKKELTIYLKTILALLNKFTRTLDSLDRSNIKDNTAMELIKEMDELVKKNNFFVSLNTEREQKVIELVKAIYDESVVNEKKNIWLISGTDSSKLHVSFGFPRQILIENLELIPLVTMPGLEKRSVLLCNYHSDGTLPIKHFNVFIHGRNVHVIAQEDLNELQQKKCLTAA